MLARPALHARVHFEPNSALRRWLRPPRRDQKESLAHQDRRPGIMGLADPIRIRNLPRLSETPRGFGIVEEGFQGSGTLDDSGGARFPQFRDDAVVVRWLRRQPHRIHLALDPFLFPAPEFLAQIELPDLARTRLGQRLVAEFDDAGQLVAAQALLQMNPQIFFGDRSARPSCDDGRGDFAPSVVRRGHHRAFQNSRMGPDSFLDFDRGNVFAAGDNDLLFSVYNIHVGLFVPHCHVAGVEPFAEHGRAGGGWVAIIAVHDLIAADDDFSDGRAVAGHIVHLGVDYADFRPRDRPARHGLPLDAILFGFVWRSIP